MTPQQRKDTGTNAAMRAMEDTGERESLMSLTVPQLKQRCAALGTPVTGTKPKLVSMILDPASHQSKKKATAGSGIKKKKKTPLKSHAHTQLKSLPAGYMGCTARGFIGDHVSDHCDSCGEEAIHHGKTVPLS